MPQYSRSRLLSIILYHKGTGAEGALHYNEGCWNRGVPSRDLGGCWGSRGVHSAKCYGKIAPSTERNGILSELILQFLSSWFRKACPPLLVGMSFVPGGDDMRVRFYLVGDNVVPWNQWLPPTGGAEGILVLCLFAERSSHSLTWARGLPVCTWGLIVLTRNSACLFVTKNY